MQSTRMSDLVSQAENEGVTLAEVISRVMSAGDMDRAQAQIESELANNYSNIAEFMSDVSVPSIDEIMNAGFTGFGVEFEAEVPLSDEIPAAIA